MPDDSIVVTIGGKKYRAPNQQAADAAKLSYLSSKYPAAVIQRAQQYANYSIPLPTGSAMKDPTMNAAISAAGEIDPDFSVPQYEARRKMVADFQAGGKHSDMVRSFNNSIQHLGTLSDAAEALHNTSTKPLNWAVNGIESMFDDPRVKNYNTARTVLSQELPKAIRGGNTAEKDVEAWQKLFDPNEGPQNQRAAVKQSLELLKAQVRDLQNQYLIGGVSPPPKFKGMFLYPDSRAVLDKMKVPAGDFDLAEQPKPQPQGQAEDLSKIPTDQLMKRLMGTK